MTMREPRIAIDGPAGAGKSTVSRRVADRLGYLLLDTGALYRCVALAAKDATIAWTDEARVGDLARAMAQREAIRFEAAAGGQRILLDGRDVSSAIRTQDIAEGASQVSALAPVREALLDMQRAAARAGGVVLEGRDIGTVVLPDAEAKFFLTASLEIRTARRVRDLEERGQHAVPEDIEREVRQRDARDTMRAVAPLRQATDAFLVDSTHMTIEEVVDAIVSRIAEIRFARASEKAE